MARTVEDCTAAFAMGEPAASGNVQSTGAALLSYGVPVARWRDGVVEVTTRHYSVTTSRHTNAAERQARALGLPVRQEDF